MMLQPTGPPRGLKMTAGAIVGLVLLLVVGYVLAPDGAAGGRTADYDGDGEVDAAPAVSPLLPRSVTRLVDPKSAAVGAREPRAAGDAAAKEKAERNWDSARKRGGPESAEGPDADKAAYKELTDDEGMKDETPDLAANSGARPLLDSSNPGEPTRAPATSLETDTTVDASSLLTRVSGPAMSDLMSAQGVLNRGRLRAEDEAGPIMVSETVYHYLKWVHDTEQSRGSLHLRALNSAIPLRNAYLSGDAAMETVTRQGRTALQGLRNDARALNRRAQASKPLVPPDCRMFDLYYTRALKDEKTRLDSFLLALESRNAPAARVAAEAETRGADSFEQARIQLETTTRSHGVMPLFRIHTGERASTARAIVGDAATGLRASGNL